MGSLNERLFRDQLRLYGLPEPRAEYRFHHSRRWRFDYAWPELLLALEVEGGAWTAGRHTRGSGFVADIEKYNEAAIEGWVVLRCVPSTLPDAAMWLARARARMELRNNANQG